MLPKMPFTKIIMLNYLNAIKKPARNEREQKNCRLKELSAYFFFVRYANFPHQKTEKENFTFPLPSFQCKLIFLLKSFNGAF